MTTADADALARGDILVPAETPPKAGGETSNAEATPKAGETANAETPPKAGGETANTEVEVEVEDDEKKAKPDARIPLSRHKELLNKERARREDLERQLAQYQKGSEIRDLNADLKKAEDKVLDMEAKYNKLLADGDTERARELMTQIRQAERSIIEMKSDARIAEATARAAEQARYDIALERIEEAYPQLNPESDSFDEEKLGDVADLKAVYEHRGMTPTQALQKAVKKLLPAPETKAQQSATTVTPRVTEQDVAAARRKAAAAKTAETVVGQPPSTAKAGEDNGRSTALTAADVMKMPQDQFAKLDEAQLAKLRGDEL